MVSVWERFILKLLTYLKGLVSLDPVNSEERGYNSDSIEGEESEEDYPLSFSHMTLDKMLEEEEPTKQPSKAKTAKLPAHEFATNELWTNENRNLIVNCMRCADIKWRRGNSKDVVFISVRLKVRPNILL